MMKKKLIVVAYHIGRIGSSATMGVLKIGGINVGTDSQLTAPAPMNPKGFFELKSQNSFLKDTFKGFYPNISDPPPINKVFRLGRLHHQAYHRLISSELGDKVPYAVKAPRFLALSFLYYLKSEFDIKVIVMNRHEKEQTESILRVWRKNPPEPSLDNASSDFVLSYIRKWKHFSLKFMKEFQFDYHSLSFEDLVDRPYQEVDKIFEFIDEKMPARQKIDDWLDLTLVNRQEYR